MAKQKTDELTGAGEVPLTLAMIAGSLATSICQNGVMKGAHDLMLALQAVRIHDAIRRVQALCECDPELISEPITDKAIGRMYELIKLEESDARSQAEEIRRKALEQAEQKKQAAA